MDENSAMCDKILTDMRNIIDGNHTLKEFSIVPINESRNKSPVLYEEYCLGLESWCVKHLYQYLYKKLFQYKPLLKKSSVAPQVLEQANKLLISALLIHPDVTTFWNMRRQLIERGISNINQELTLTKLVLSHKSKSNECFAYRKWIINKSIKNIMDNDIAVLLNSEFAVTKMAAEKSHNNYHAWSHRIWCTENVFTRTNFPETPSYLSTILNELDFSNHWVNKHVSEHTGFHYRQYLCNSILKNSFQSIVPDLKYHCLIEPFIGLKFTNCDNIEYLNSLLGKYEGHNNNHTMLKCHNYVYYFIILLSDLFYYIGQLNETFPGHEAIWYHRRFIIFSLLKGAYDYHEITWKKIFTPPKSIKDLNITSYNINGICASDEKSVKLLKYDTDKVECSYLYKLIIEAETKCIKEGIADKLNCTQRDLAIKHAKWLKFGLGLNKLTL